MLWILGVLIFLLTTSYFVLRSPRVQTYIAQKTANYLSEMLNTEVSIGGVNINFSLDIVLEELMVKDQHHNPLISIKELQIDVKKIKRKKNMLSFDKLVMDSAFINITKYKEDSVVNWQFIADNLSSDDTVNVIDTIPLRISVADLRIINSGFVYQDQHRIPRTGQIDFDNINISRFNLSLNDFLMLGDTVSALIKRISLYEQSGFVLHDFQSDFKMSSSGMHAKDLKILTGNSDLSLDLIFDYKDFTYFNDFLHRMKIISRINESVLDMNDLGYFAPELYGMHNVLTFSCNVKGSIDNLRVKQFKLEFGKSSHFFGNVSMNGLPDIRETYINTAVKELVTNQEDMAEVIIPGDNGTMTNLEVDKILSKFGDIKIKGHFTGFYNDFVANASLYSSLGSLSTDMIFKQDEIKPVINYSGKLEAEEFDFGYFTGLQDYFGKFNLVADIEGSGLTEESVTVEMHGTIDSLDFNNNNYNSISINGNYADETFNGSLIILDEVIHLDFLGEIDFSKNQPVFDFTSVIKNADLNKLKLVSAEEDMMLSTKLNINFTGLSIDSIIGSIQIDSTAFRKDELLVQMDHLKLDVNNDSSGVKYINLVSDYVDASLNGRFYLRDIHISFDKFLEEYLKSVDMISDSIKDIYSDVQTLSFQINLKNTDDISDIFIPQLSVSPNTEISGSYYSDRGDLEFDVTADEIIYADSEFKNFFLKGKSVNQKILVRTGCQRFMVSDSLGLDNFALNASIINDSVYYYLLWDNQDSVKNRGDIEGFVNFNNNPGIEGKFNKFDVVINDSLWNVDKNNSIILDSSSVKIVKMNISSDNQFVKVNGTISEDPDDKIDLEFKEFDISNFDLLLVTDDLDINGFLNGKATMIDLYNSPNFISDISIRDLQLNNNELGSATLQSSWNDIEQSLYLKAEITYQGNYGENKTLLVDGYYSPVDSTSNFDLDIAINNFKLKTIEEVFSGFSSDVSGLVSGSIKLAGTKDEPELTGEIKFLRTSVKVDYLNTTYSFTDEIEINKDNFRFNGITLYDSLGNTAVVNGKISHDRFKKDFFLDVNLKATNLSCLNTSVYQNNEFYGSVFFTGDVGITGSFKDIDIDISGETQRKTKFFIPLGSASSVSDNNYIKFINPYDTIPQEPDQVTRVTNLNLGMNLKVTSDAGIEIIMPSNTGNLKANGDGNIKLDINPDDDFTIFGDYVISKGSYLFTIQNVIHKYFTIRPGGTIKWNGNPTDADISLRGVYSLRTPLNGLMQVSDSSGTFNQRIAVDCILDLKGKLFNPEIKFSIVLPDADQEINELVYSQIDTNNQAQMSEQMIFLLVLNQFKPVSGNEVAMYSGVGATSFDILTNQLNSWLSRISDDFDIGLNYRPGNDITSKEIEVALSTQLFNDRVLIDGNFGVAGTDDTESTSNIVGDVNVEVKITPDGRFRVKAFNKTNNVNSIEYNAPYTQGVGVFYRKEFDNLGDLFRRKKKDK